MTSKTKRTSTLHWRGSVASRSVASALVRKAGDYVIVERGRPRWLILRCPSGCGDELSINLDRRAGPAWLMYRQRKVVTLFPSVVLQSGCRSHFVVWKNRVYWCDGWDVASEDLTRHDDYDAHLESKIIATLQQSGSFVHFADIAEKVDALPWAVLVAAKRLARHGQLTEGQGEQDGFFAAQRGSRMRLC